MWALAILLALFGEQRCAAKREGVLAEKLAQNAVHIASQDSALKIQRGALQRDTVRLFRQVDHTITRLDTLVKSDTLYLTDTVKVTVEVVREAQATILACRETVSECGRVAAAEKSRGDSLSARLRLVEAQRPSKFGSVLKYAGVAFGAYWIGTHSR